MNHTDLCSLYHVRNESYSTLAVAGFRCRHVTPQYSVSRVENIPFVKCKTRRNGVGRSGCRNHGHYWYKKPKEITLRKNEIFSYPDVLQEKLHYFISEGAPLGRPWQGRASASCQDGQLSRTGVHRSVRIPSPFF